MGTPHLAQKACTTTCDKDERAVCSVSRRRSDRGWNAVAGMKMCGYRT